MEQPGRYDVVATYLVDGALEDALWDRPPASYRPPPPELRGLLERVNRVEITSAPLRFTRLP